jgi:hypothetical protein
VIGKPVHRKGREGGKGELRRKVRQEQSALKADVETVIQRSGDRRDLVIGKPGQQFKLQVACFLSLITLRPLR